MKRKLFVVLLGVFFLAVGCAPSVYFGVPSKTIMVPEKFGQTEALVEKAESSSGAQYCPDKVAKARELGKKGVETYWACRTEEALGLLAESRKLAEEAMLCKAPPKPMPMPPPPPKDSDGDGVYDSMDKCPGTPIGARVDARGCWVLTGVQFDTNKWDISPQYYKTLDAVVLVLKKNRDLRIEIQGHTDNRGSAKYNQGLSEKRAKAVMDYFINEGISRDRLIAKGYGLSKPAYPNTTPENRAKNRRVELTPIR